MLTQISQQKSTSQCHSAVLSAGINLPHPLFKPPYTRSSPPLETPSQQKTWSPLSPSAIIQSQAPYPTLVINDNADVPQKQSNLNHSASQPVAPMPKNPPVSQSKSRGLAQKPQSSTKLMRMKTLPTEMKRKRTRRPKIVPDLSTSTVTTAVRSECNIESTIDVESSLINDVNLSIQNIVLPNISFDSLIISDIVLGTFDTVVAPTFSGNSPLEIQIKIFVTRLIITQNLPRILNPIIPIMNLLSTSDLINIVIYSLQLSGVSL